MGFKKLFINTDEPQEEVKSEVKSEVKKESSVKFPSSNEFETQTSTKQNKSQGNPDIQKHLEKFAEIYHTTFEGLNQPGYDFFEYYTAVISGDISDSKTYVMAFNMGKAMDKTITKEKLLEYSEYYVAETNKIYNKFITDGNAKKQDLENQKHTENENLSSELTSLKQQLESIKVQIQDKENKLSLIDNKYQPLIFEVENKLTANDEARNKMMSTIETVKQGIINNLK